MKWNKYTLNGMHLSRLDQAENRKNLHLQFYSKSQMYSKGQEFLEG